MTNNEDERLKFIRRIDTMHEDNIHNNLSLEEAEAVWKMYCKAELRGMVQKAKTSLEISQRQYESVLKQAHEAGVFL